MTFKKIWQKMIKKEPFFNFPYTNFSVDAGALLATKTKIRKSSEFQNHGFLPLMWWLPYHINFFFLFRYGKIELENLNCEKYFRGARIYGDTKLANLLFTFELARKLSFEGFKNITVNAVHPGPVNTGLFRHIPYYGWIIKLLAQIFYYSPLVLKYC